MIRMSRLLQDLEQFSKIGHGPQGTTRLAYTEEWMKAQMTAKKMLEDAEMLTSFDAMGNLAGFRKGRNSELALVAVGSHLDTVPDGGNFDGVLGVASGIEIARALNEDEVETKRGLLVISFACEEGSRFGVGCIGSKFIAGELCPDDAEKIHDLNGLTLSRCLAEAGLLPSMSMTLRRKWELSAYVEMHIEQGPVLENLDKSIGVVTGIAAPTRCLVDITGRTGHVGTVPMKARKDALLAASEIITGVEDVVRRTDDTGVGTVGRVEIEPNSVTAIPGHVKLWIDLRYLNDEKKKTCVTGINKLITDIKNERELKITLKTLTDERSTKLSNRVINTIRQATESFGYAYHEMSSGAMHDAAHIAKITDAGMIFVPCKSGISHAPEESADPKHINAGLNVLYKTLVKLANE